MRRGVLVCPVTVGRDVEIHELSLALDEARLGRGRAIGITGEPGVGKTRLTREAASVAERLGMTVLTGRAAESASPVPYRLIGSSILPAFRRFGPPDDPVLRPYRSALSLLIPDWASGDTALIGTDAGLVVLEAAARLFSVLAAKSGLLLVLEDLQWADAETLAVVEYLADTIASERVLGLVTVRSGEEGPAEPLLRRLATSASGAVLRLDRLESEAVENMVRATLGTENLPDGLARSIERDAEGLPLAAEELLADLVGRGVLTHAHAEWLYEPSGAPRAPAAFNALVSQRLSRLTPDARTVVAAASLLGREFDWSLLGSITGLTESEVLTSLGEAVRVQLIDAASGAVMRFRHALIHASVAAEVSGPERRRLALRAADALLSRTDLATAEDLELAASLREQAGDRRRAAALLLRLGKDSLARAALVSAEDVLNRARVLAGGDLELLVDIEGCLVEVGEQRGIVARTADVARSLMDHVRALQPSPERLSSSRLLFARAAIGAGRFDDASRALDDAAAASTEGVEQARIEAIRAQLSVEAGDYPAAREHATRALDMAATKHEPSIACEALYISGRVDRYLNPDPAAGAMWLERMVAIAEDAGLAHLQLRGLLELALLDRMTTHRQDRMEHVRALAEERGAVRVATIVDLNLGSMLLGVEHKRAALLINAAVERSRRLGLPTLRFGLTLQTLVHALSGDRRAYDAVVAEGSRFPEVARQGALNWSLVHDEIAIAFEQLDAGWGPTSPAGAEFHPAPQRGLWALAATVLQKDGAAARRRITDAGVGSWENRGLVALAEAVDLGHHGKREAAAEQLAQFEHDWGDPDRYSFLPTIALVWASRPAFADGWGQPVTWVRRARQFFTALGNSHQVRLCDRQLREMGQPVPRRGRGDASVPASLRGIGVTSREMDVLLLVAHGLSNRDIGARLHVSERTVETHVTQLLAKTGARTRLQLLKTAERLTDDNAAETAR